MYLLLESDKNKKMLRGCVTQDFHLMYRRWGFFSAVWFSMGVVWETTEAELVS